MADAASEVKNRVTAKTFIIFVVVVVQRLLLVGVFWDWSFRFKWHWTRWKVKATLHAQIESGAATCPMPSPLVHQPTPSCRHPRTFYSIPFYSHQLHFLLH